MIDEQNAAAKVIAVASDAGHNTIKPLRPAIILVAGLGVKGDAHLGKTVQHLYDKRRNPYAPNLRQVHLMHAELFDELAGKGITVTSGQMGENIVTRGIDLLGLPQGTRLHMGEAVIEITGLRNPCSKINIIHPDLLKAVIEKRADGSLNRKTGVMAVVITGGAVTAGDAIVVVMPEGEPVALEPV